MKRSKLLGHFTATVIQISIIMFCMGAADHLLRLTVDSAERWVFWIVPAGGAAFAVALISLHRYLTTRNR